MAIFSEAFIFLAEGADPSDRGMREHELARTAFVPVPDRSTAVGVARDLAAEGLDLLEL